MYLTKYILLDMGECTRALFQMGWGLDRVRRPDQGNRNVVGPEVEGEVEEDNLDAAAVEVLAVQGHQGAKDRVKGEDWDNNQAVESVHGKELVHHWLQLPQGHLQKFSSRKYEDKTNPSLQHSDIDHDIEKAFNSDQKFESCGQVKIKTKIRFKLFFNSGCGDSRALLDLIPDWVIVEPEHDGDEDDGEDEDDEEADADVDQQTSHHAVRCVNLHKVKSEKIFLLNFSWNVRLERSFVS